MESVPKIIKLENEVINRIAAGEVVQRPSSVVKELIENSIDAGATNISVTIKQGGLGMIQIQDNGHGIRKDDLEIVCERFTTSKLKVYDDLKFISTFGFRGEALASITHIAQVQIVTRTKDSQCAFRCKYSNGKLIPFTKNESRAEPKPCAGLVGTIITVEDLFYNMPIRKKAFKNLTDEYNKIVEVIQKYSIEYSSTERPIVFSCRKADGNTSAANMNNSDYLSSATGRCIENIRLCYGDMTSKELIDLHLPNVLLNDQSVPTNHPMIYGNADTIMATVGTTSYTPLFSHEPLHFSITGKISKALTQLKKSTIVLFINGRLVENTSIKKLIDHIYQEILPKHTFPFAYLSIKLPSHCVDVNVHPTKREVHFLYEDVVLYRLHEECMKLLMNVNESRMFKVQTILPYPTTTTTMSATNTSSMAIPATSSSTSMESMLGNTLPMPSTVSHTDRGVEIVRVSPTKKRNSAMTSQPPVEQEEWMTNQKMTSSPLRLTVPTTMTTTTQPPLFMESFLPAVIPETVLPMNMMTAEDIEHTPRYVSAVSSSSSSSSSSVIPHLSTTTNQAMTSSGKKRKDPSSSSSTIPSTVPLSANKMVRVDGSSSKLPQYFQRLPVPHSSAMMMSHTSPAPDEAVNEEEQEEVEEMSTLFCQEIRPNTCPKKTRMSSSFLQPENVHDNDDDNDDESNTVTNTAGRHPTDTMQCLCCPPGALRMHMPPVDVNVVAAVTAAERSEEEEEELSSPHTVTNSAYPTIPMIIHTPQLLTELDTDIQQHIQEMYTTYHQSIHPATASTTTTLCSSTIRFPLFQHLYDHHHTALSTIWKGSIYIGSVDASYGLFQYQTKLYLFPYYPILANFFYQYTLLQFPFFHILQLSPTLDLMTLLQEGYMSMQQHSKKTEKSQKSQKTEKSQETQKTPEKDQVRLLQIANRLLQHTEYFSALFRIHIHPVTRHLESIPDIVPGYHPSHAQLGSLLYLLGIYVDWEEDDTDTLCSTETTETTEQQPQPQKKMKKSVDQTRLMMQICQVIGYYYALLPTEIITHPVGSRHTPSTTTSATSTSVALTDTAKEEMAHVLFPLLKRYYLPASSDTLPVPHTITNHNHMLMEVTSLEQLYKVFERC